MQKDIYLYHFKLMSVSTSYMIYEIPLLLCPSSIITYGIYPLSCSVLFLSFCSRFNCIFVFLHTACILQPLCTVLTLQKHGYRDAPCCVHEHRRWVQRQPMWNCKLWISVFPHQLSTAVMYSVCMKESPCTVIWNKLAGIVNSVKQKGSVWTYLMPSAPVSVRMYAVFLSESRKWVIKRYSYTMCAHTMPKMHTFLDQYVINSSSQ